MRLSETAKVTLPITMKKYKDIEHSFKSFSKMG
jgi:hypothetical protein